MHVVLCTNIEPTPDPASLRGRNHAIIERLRVAGHEVDVSFGPEGLLGGEDQRNYDAGMLCPNDLIEAVPDPSGRLRAETVAIALERAGVRFVNSPIKRRYASNKLLTHIALRSASIPQPTVWTMESLAQIQWPSDGMIVKPVFGSGGLGVRLLKSVEQAAEHLATVQEVCFLQQFVPNARCIRVVATQSEVVGRYEKRVTPGTLVAGITSGAEEVKLAPRGDLDAMAIAMTKAVHMDIIGADILEDPSGRLFGLEINANFGFYPKNSEILDALLRSAEQIASDGAQVRSTPLLRHDDSSPLASIRR